MRAPACASTAALVSVSALLALAAPARALTPEELLATWEAQAMALAGTAMGIAVERPGDGSVVLPGIGPAGESVTLRPDADGSVAIEAPIPEGQTVPLGTASGGVEWRAPGLALVARDGAAPGAVRYELAAPSLTVVTLPGTSAQGSAVDLGVELQDAIVTLELPGAEGGGLVEIAIRAGGLAYAYSGGDAAMGLGQTATSRNEDVAIRYAITLPPSLTLASLGTAAQGSDEEAAALVLQALQDGLSVVVEGSTGASAQGASMQSPFLSYDYSIRSGGTSGAFELSLAGVSGQASATGTQVSVSSPMMPMPSVDVGLGSFGIEIDIPLSATPAPFTYRLSLEDVTAGEEAWAMIDPEGRLPRDPARLAFDVGGVVALDAAAMVRAGMEGQVPPEPRVNSVELRSLDMAALGATATATGALTFDAAMTPSGSGALTLTGATGVLDAVEAMGLLPPDALSQARLGLAMFFDPAGEDTLATDVTLGADGSVTVNGQRVQ